MAKKRSIVILMVTLLLVTVCFGACSTREDIEIYLDWGSYRQTVKVKYGSVVNARTVPYLGYDFVDGLYNDASFTKRYFFKRITTPYTLYVKTSTKYPLEKEYCEGVWNTDFDPSCVSILMNRGFTFDSALQADIENAGVEKVYVDYSYNIGAGQGVDSDDFRQHVIILLSTSSKEKVVEAIRIIEQFPQVYYVGPNRYLELEQSSDDPKYSMQWALDKIDIQNAWNYTTGSSNIRVGIIDTGISDHEDLIGNVVEGYDFVNNNSVTNDIISSHGTMVAGIVGASGNNNVGISGINWNVSLVPLQVSNINGEINSAACVKAVEYATETYKTNEPIQILNFSIGSYEAWSELEDAIRKYPGLFVCSTGNSGGNNDDAYHYPSFYGSSLYSNPISNIISVGRSDRNDTRPTNSNRGKNTIDLFAPGENIYTTNPSGYIVNSGSSFAAPHVAGVAALILSKSPNLTTAQLKYAILNSVDKVDNLTDVCVTGGRLNAYKALMMVSHNTHKYDFDYEWINTMQHNAICVCGEIKVQGHAVSAGSSILAMGYKICLFCGGRADYGFMRPNSEEIIFVTDNGSYILPNGIVVLVDDDIQAYIDGTLKFYDKNTVVQ